MNTEDVIDKVIGFGLLILLGLFVIFPLMGSLILLAVLEVEYLFRLILGS